MVRKIPRGVIRASFEDRVFNIDTVSLYEGFDQAIPRTATEALAALALGGADFVQGHAIKAATAELNTSREAYIQSFSPPTLTGRGVATFFFAADGSDDAKLARMVEEGTTPWDMKPSLLQNAETVTGEDEYGTYTTQWRVIGFSHKAYGTDPKGAGRGTPIGHKRFHGFGMGKMWQGVSAQADKLRVGETFQGRPGYKIPHVVKKQVGDMTAAYEHRENLYQAMMRIKKQRNKDTLYESFRTVSDASDQDAWWYPTTPAHSFIDKAIEELGDWAVDEVDRLIVKGQKRTA